MNEKKRLLVLGMDGLDPVITRRLMDQGQLPTFQKIAAKGSFGPLATSNPPQSPVAWSCFISGCNPGHHNIFDFITRDTQTYQPSLSMTEEKPGSTNSFQSRRKGPAIWKTLGDAGIENLVIRCPATFPPEPLKGHLLTGMGTPDLLGTQGLFTFFTDAEDTKPEIQGRIIRLAFESDTVTTALPGPRKRTGNQIVEVTCPLQIQKIAPDRIRIKGPDSSVSFSVREWSEWTPLEFKMGLFSKLRGICRFYLQSTSPFALYCSAINVDPQKPAFPISYPSDFASCLHAEGGNFSTMGMPYDTWALNEGRLTEEAFLEQAYAVLEETLKIFRSQVKNNSSGFLFCYFGITDLIQHMFWRYEDPGHPHQGKSENPAVRNAIADVYRRMDAVVAEMLETMNIEKDPIIILSDHGFTTFRRAMHVNRWLRDEGYLALNADRDAGLFSAVDWSNTRAYAVGFGGIYLNRFGREKEGVIYKGAESDQLKREISEKLLALRDGTDSPVRRVFRSEDLYTGSFADAGPDLVVGFNSGYRASWQTALGATPDVVFEDNRRAWSGDHLCDPDLVPGVLLSTLPLQLPSARLIDIAPTIFHYFGLPTPAEMDGKSLL